MLRISLLVLTLGSAGSALAQVSYSFTDFACPGSTDTRAFGINDSTLIVGNCRTTGRHGFVYNGDSFTTVQPVGSFNSSLRGINRDGIMVGYYLLPEFDFIRGFVRIDEFEYRDIVPPGAQDTFATGINSLNLITGGYFDVLARPPYNTRGTRRVRSANDGIYRRGGGSQLLLKWSPRLAEGATT